LECARTIARQWRRFKTRKALKDLVNDLVLPNKEQLERFLYLTNGERGEYISNVTNINKDKEPEVAMPIGGHKRMKSLRFASARDGDAQDVTKSLRGSRKSQKPGQVAPAEQESKDSGNHLVVFIHLV
jgi:hypothetical protein